MKNLMKSRIWLVVIGVCLGLLARWAVGGPEVSDFLPRTFSTPYQELDEPAADESQESIDLPIINQSQDTGLVPPIRVPGIEANSGMLDNETVLVATQRSFDTFFYGDSATFEAHGEQICASGCAASRHPTDTLTQSYFHELLDRFAVEPLSENSPALEELLYFGPQTKSMIEDSGFSPLDSSRASLLWEQLQISHAKISIRVVDESGEVRTWLEPTLVPFDRRHVFKMETNNLQPLVTSGTVKRVGLNHLWVRL